MWVGTRPPAPTSAHRPVYRRVGDSALRQVTKGGKTYANGYAMVFSLYTDPSWAGERRPWVVIPADAYDMMVNPKGTIPYSGTICSPGPSRAAPA